MTSFFNFYSNIKNLIEPRPNKNNLKKNIKSQPNKLPVINTPASTQAANFKKYQQKIQKTTVGKNNIFKEVFKEGFELLPDLQLDGNGLTAQTTHIINQNLKNDPSSPENNVANVLTQYNNTLNQYENAIGEITGTTSSYFNRISPNNPYLNQVIQFPTGELSYVTNQGVAKFIPSTDILTSINAPSKYVKVTVPFDKSYKNTGATIGTNPNLITGTPVVSGQSLGNEGQNVYVNTMITNPNTSYQGCFTDNASAPMLEFVGGSPPPPLTNFQNGDFNQPQLKANSIVTIDNALSNYQTSNTISNQIVPGWSLYNISLLNSYNDILFGDIIVPVPYPQGNQCVLIAGTGMLQTNPISFATGITYNLSFYACGFSLEIFNDLINITNPFTITLDTTTIYTFDPSSYTNLADDSVYNSWNLYSTTFTVPTNGNFSLIFQGVENFTAIQYVQLTIGSTSSGTYTYEDCQQTAIDQGSLFFALQNVNPTTSTGYCAVGSLPGSSTNNLKTSYVPSDQIALWSSNTQGQSGNTSLLTTSGALSVINSGGQSVFATPNSTAQPSNYLGCYGDNPNRAMSFAGGGSQSFNLSECQQFAQQNNYQYFGLQNSTSGQNAQCAVSNDFSHATQYGIAGNCTQISDGTYSGGGWSNTIYNNTTPDSNYYLILQDDGNMCIYRGQNPNDNQGLIWASNTAGQQQKPNTNYTAVNGKYGTNWISSGSTMAAGDFVGSTNGNLVLIMQSDGNLVLYTYKNVLNCQKMTDGNMGGGVLANALYNVGKVGFPSNMSQLAYVDENSETHSYPSTNKQYINSYTTVANNTSSGNAIPNASYGDTTVDDCQQTCNSISQCAGFVFNTDNNVCTPMDSTMFPSGTREISNGNDLYIRNINPISPPTGVNENTSNIDTITYQNYVNGGQINSDYGLASLIEKEQPQVFSLEDQMDSLTGQINDYTDRFNQGARVSSMQTSKNYKGIKNYLTEIKDINKDIKHFNTNADNILKDSDIVVLQQNYNYLFWSILAVATVLISINVVKK